MKLDSHIMDEERQQRTEWENERITEYMRGFLACCRIAKSDY
jgi:hypothetical protein